eukprot:6485790-Amphidinium_carterae.2
MKSSMFFLLVGCVAEAICCRGLCEFLAVLQFAPQKLRAEIGSTFTKVRVHRALTFRCRWAKLQTSFKHETSPFFGRLATTMALVPHPFVSPQYGARHDVGEVILSTVQTEIITSQIVRLMVWAQQAGTLGTQIVGREPRAVVPRRPL